jgi:hypothetical protein
MKLKGKPEPVFDPNVFLTKANGATAEYAENVLIF